MNKRKGIFAAILVVQFVLPMLMCVSALLNQHLFNVNSYEIKVLLDEVRYEGYGENSVSITFTKDAMYEEFTRFWTFYPDNENEGFYEVSKGRDVNSNGLYYICSDEYADWLMFDYEIDTALIEKTGISRKTFYHKENESWNLTTGHFTGNPTQAYATVRVRNGLCEVTGVYICGYEINDFIQRYINGEFSLDVYAYKLGTITTDSGEDVNIPEYDVNGETAPYTSDENGNY